MVTFHDLIVCSQVYVGPKNTVQYNIRADQTLDPSACDNSIVRVIGFAFPIARFKVQTTLAPSSISALGPLDNITLSRRHGFGLAQRHPAIPGGQLHMAHGISLRRTTRSHEPLTSHPEA